MKAIDDKLDDIADDIVAFFKGKKNDNIFKD